MFLRRTFEEIITPKEIHYFQLTIIAPNKQAYVLTHKPDLCYELFDKGHKKLLHNTLPLLYKNNEFFWWNDAKNISSIFANDITNNNLNLKNGFCLVRKWDSHYLLYFFAFNKHDNSSISNIVNKLNYFLKLGDKYYNKILILFLNVNDSLTMSQINTHYDFIGGIPLDNFLKNNNPNSMNKTVVIPVNFKQ